MKAVHCPNKSGSHVGFSHLVKGSSITNIVVMAIVIYMHVYLYILPECTLCVTVLSYRVIFSMWIHINICTILRYQLVSMRNRCVLNMNFNWNGVQGDNVSSVLYCKCRINIYIANLVSVYCLDTSISGSHKLHLLLFWSLNEY